MLPKNWRARQKAVSKDSSHVNTSVKIVTDTLRLITEVVFMATTAIVTSIGITAMGLPPFSGDGLQLVLAVCAVKTLGGQFVSYIQGALGAR